MSALSLRGRVARGHTGISVYLLPGWNSPRLENWWKGHSPLLAGLAAGAAAAAEAVGASEPQSAGAGSNAPDIAGLVERYTDHPPLASGAQGHTVSDTGRHALAAGEVVQ